MLYTYASYALFGATSALILICTLRQLIFSIATVNRPIKGRFSDIETLSWPKVTIIVPAHNEERVIEGCLEHLVALNYPDGHLKIVAVNDRSTDGTKAIIDRFQEAYPNLITGLHRAGSAAPGKAAAVQDALDVIEAEVVVFFDADYLPGPDILRRLVAPFADPTVGATMGRVLPYNGATNLLTRLLDLERRGGYAIDQKARSQFGLLPQFGGTVGGIRLSAMKAAGGWPADTLAEDTDITYRLFVNGWTVEYVDDAICFEEAPEAWQVRYKQVRRWASGHNQCLIRYLGPTLTARQPLLRRLDAAFVLMFYLIPPLSLLSMANALVFPTHSGASIVGLALASLLAFFVAFGNFAPYFQIFAATLRDRATQVALYLPFLFVSSAISLLAASDGLLRTLHWAFSRKPLKWDKTTRYRTVAHDAA